MELWSAHDECSAAVPKNGKVSYLHFVKRAKSEINAS